MKRVLLILLTACLMASCGNSNTNYVKKAVKIMDKYGIYAQGDEWENAKNEALSANPETIEEAQEIVIKTGKVAGGKHTFLITADGIKENNNAEWEMPTVEIMEDGIALIKLPHFMGNHEDGVKYANTVLNAIPDDLQGVVIDLRGNRGGNMHPMIAAVHRFLPDDVILKFQTRNYCKKINVKYVLQIAGVTQQTHIECPVAILTDSMTASSGEAVLICFRGMENARTFGSPTAGYASCNQPFGLPDGSQLVLTIGADVARTDEVFCDDPIQPDVMTETPLETALDWIKNLINMEQEMKFCQSCGMPLNAENLGTNADGSKNEDYCMYCSQNGKFTNDCTMDEMIEFCAQFVDEVNKNMPKPMTKEEYKDMMYQYFPTLKRWKK